MDAAAVVQDCGGSSQGLAIVAQLRAAGLGPSRVARAVKTKDIVRIHRRVYACAPLPGWTQFVITDEGVAAAYVAHVRAAMLSLGPGAAAHGRTAAALRGWPMLVEPSRTVELAVPHGSRRAAVDRVKVTERRQLACELFVALPDTDGLLVTTAVQTLLDCGRSLPLVEAVVLLDSALRARDVTVAELRRAAQSLPGRRDAARVRRVLSLCDPDSGSVLETVLRVRMLLDGIEGFSTQLTLRDAAGRHVHRADFCFEAAGLVVEVDGEKWHQDVARDRIRDNQLAALGWRVLRYRWAEVVHNPSAVLLEIRAAAALGTSDCQSGADRVAAAA